MALQAIASKLSLELAPSNPTSALARYLRPITKECNEHLREPLHKLAKPAGLILSSLCQTSPVALFLIVKAILPSLLTLYQDMEGIAQKKALLEVFVQIFDAAITVCDSKNAASMDSEIPNPLDLFKDRLFDIASQALMSTFADEVSFRIVAANLLSRFCSLRHYLLQNEIGMIIQYLNDIILFDDQNGPDDLKREAIQALVEISRSKPNLVMDISFPVFMARLPDLESTENNDYLVTLEGLARLSVERTIAETLIRRLINKLDLVLQKDQASSSYPRAILSTLYYILSSQQNLAEDQNLGFYYGKILVALINQVVLASTGICPPTSLNEDTSMETLGRLGNLIVRATTPDQKRSVGLQVYSLFTEASLFPPIPSRESLPPKKQRMTMILSTWMMAGIPSGVRMRLLEPNISHMLMLVRVLGRWETLTLRACNFFWKDWFPFLWLRMYPL